jgi:ParB-like chromosome segregation protein Spo0J
MKIVNLALTAIKPYWRNPRDNAEAVEAVKSSIEAFGFNQPIVVDGENVIIAGHTRYRAATELGYTKVPCVVVELDAQAAKAYRIADNKSGELATWDLSKLIPELREIEDIESMQVYFGDEDIAALLGEAAGEGGGVTEAQIERAESEQAGQFEQIETNATAGMVEVLCTHCGEKSYVSRDDVLRRTEVAAA